MKTRWKGTQNAGQHCCVKTIPDMRTPPPMDSLPKGWNMLNFLQSNAGNYYHSCEGLLLAIKNHRNQDKLWLLFRPQVLRSGWQNPPWLARVPSFCKVTEKSPLVHELMRV